MQWVGAAHPGCTQPAARRKQHWCKYPMQAQQQCKKLREPIAHPAVHWSWHAHIYDRRAMSPTIARFLYSRARSTTNARFHYSRVPLYKDRDAESILHKDLSPSVGSGVQRLRRTGTCPQVAQRSCSLRCTPALFKVAPGPRLPTTL